MTEPLVRVVVVNYNGGDLTLECLRSLRGTEWPSDRLELVLVDNASTDDVVARVRRELPEVRVIESLVNTGFAGGCNLGLRDLGAVEHIALVNSDACVEAEWLRPLVDALAGDARLGAACPKIVFAGRFAEVIVRAPTHRPGRGDGRALGVRVSGARVDAGDVWTRVQWVRGDWGREAGLGNEPEYRWTHEEAVLRLPVPDTGFDAGELRLAAPDDVTVELTAAGVTAVHTVGPVPTWYRAPLGPPITVVNNAGTELTTDGYGADRGYLELDDGRFDQPAEVFAWCGAGVLLRRAYLDDVGLFDERLFLYYEDLELAWRGRERGWRYRYVPTSVVHHVHAASTVEGSARSEYFNERNRLAVALRHARGRDATRVFVRHALVTASYARRDIAAPLLHGRGARGRSVLSRLRSFGAALRLAPGMVASRHRDRQAAQSSSHGMTP